MSAPFTYDELFAVFSRLVPSDEAREWAMAALPDDEVTEGDMHDDGGMAYRSASHNDFTKDTLMMLALHSDATAEKVRQYRAERRGGQPESAREAEGWALRYAELKAWADAGYPLLDE